MRYNLYKRKKDNIYEYIECKISDTKFDDYKELWDNFNDNDYIVNVSDNNLAFPILIGSKLREMTREEKIILLGDAILLKDGEYVEDGHIVQVPNPSTKYLRYNWNRNTFEWELSTTKEELMLRRVDLIMEYNDLKNKITTLEELREFESTETIELLKTKMNKIKEEADMLLEKIKKLK